MNIQNFIKICFVAILLISCNKEEEYIPMFASAQQRTVKLSCVDKDGNDLLADEDFVDQIKIYGCLSKKELKFQIDEITKDGKSQNYLYFSPDLPNTNDMQYEGNYVAYGRSQFVLTINKQKTTFSCLYRFHLSKIPDLIGGSSIALISITDGDNIAEQFDIGKSLPLCLEIDEGSIKIQ